MNEHNQLPCICNGQLHRRGRPFLVLGGELHNSSASSLCDIEPKFDRLVTMHLNTVLVPLSWELVEPEEGEFDFTLVDGIIATARAHGLSLVFLWFGTLKNAASCYAPAWVRTDATRFPRAQTAPGESTLAISCFGDEILHCDMRAFAAVMRRICEVDGEAHTVLMMQVENEPGILGGRRDFSPPAEARFTAPVPDELLRYLAAHREWLVPEMAKTWAANGEKMAAENWTEAFGDDADEVFMAWYIARFVDQVAEAGRAEYPLPMFANVWLKNGPEYLPGNYPSGGAVISKLDIWKCAAPHLDFIGPDIYRQFFREMCQAYDRPDNPLFIPEVMSETANAGRVLYAYGRHRAIGCCPFAIDDLDAAHPLAETYRHLRHMAPFILDAQQAGQISGFLQQADEEEFSIDLGNFRFNARCITPFDRNTVPGSALLIAHDNDEFFIAGYNLLIKFAPCDPGCRAAEAVFVDEGKFIEGTWTAQRRLNGDETIHGTGVILRDQMTTLRFKLHGYR